METPIWFLISEDIQRKFRALASADFKPPGDEFKHVTLKVEMESLDEIDKEMRHKPKGKVKAK